MTTTDRLCTAIAVLLLVLAAPFAARAMSAYDLLRIDPSVRGAALGGQPVAIVNNDLGALTVNPAGLAGLTGDVASVAYADHPLDLASGHIAYGRPAFNGFSALSLTYFDYGSFDKIPTAGGPVQGSFTASDILLTGGYGRTLPHGLSVGAAGKLLYSKIDTYSSSALAVDLGALWQTGWSMTDIAVSVTNLGTQLTTYDGVSESLPLTLHAGFAKQLEHLPLVLTATGHMEPGETLYATAAGEFTVSPLLKLRAGYTTLAKDYQVGGPQDGTSGLSAGIGLTHNRMHLDYAFHSQGALGQVHRLGFGVAL